MTSRELCNRLGITRKRLRGWLKRGLPHTMNGRFYVFDPAAVLAWLESESLVGPETQNTPGRCHVVQTLGEVAEALGVSINTLTNWRQRGMPGEPGPPGSGRGQWDLLEIFRWYLREQGGRDTSVSQRRAAAQANVDELKAERLRLRLHQDAVSLIDREEVEQFFAALKATIREVVERVPDELEQQFPAEQRTTIRMESQRRIETILDELESQQLDVAQFVDGDDQAEETFRDLVDGEVDEAAGERVDQEPSTLLTETVR